jgi:hypothetical protein
MALRNIIAPVAALIFASAFTFSPATAAPANSSDHGGARAGGGGGSHSAGARSSGGAPPAHHGGGGFHGGYHASGGNHYAGHRSYGRTYYHYQPHYRHYYGGGTFVFPWGLFGAFGQPPYYYVGHSYLVCRYRWVRRHGRLVRRRYCWRRYR